MKMYPEVNGTLNTQGAETAIEKTKKVRPLWKELMIPLVKIASVALAFVLLFTFLFGIARVQDPSMDPSIKDGDMVIFYRHKGGAYESGDVIAFRKDGQIQVRRVIAVSGDTVDITGEGILINGALQSEIGIFRDTERYQEGIDFPLTVPERQIFVLGDNRTGATDSRIYGCVSVKDALGRVMTIIRRRSI